MSAWKKEMSGGGGAHYAVRVILILLLERSSSVCVDSSASWPPTASRGLLLPKEKTLQRSPAPEMGRFTAVDDLGDRVLDFEIQIVKY